MMTIDALSAMHARLSCTIYAVPQPAVTWQRPAAAGLGHNYVTCFANLWHPAKATLAQALCRALYTAPRAF